MGDAPSEPKRKQSKQKQPKPSDAAKSEHAGLKETARKIIRDLPPEGRRIYETTFGPVARRLLKQSLELGDIQQLRQITQRYFYTPAGHEAALLFAQHEADQGRHLTAALTYQQLLETAEAVERFQPQLSVLAATSWLAAGHRDRAARVLQSLSERGVRRVQLSGQDSLVQAAPNGMVDWLTQTVGVPVSQDVAAVSQWLTARGNPARNGHAEGGLPHLRVRWQVRLLEHHKLEAIEQEMAGMLARQEKSRLPAATPLAVGDYVITRSVHGLIAIDFKTGKRIWQAQPQQAALLHDLMDVSGRLNDNANGNRNGNNLESAQSFSRLIWEDYLYNTTSSDGKRVYVIRDLALPKLDRSRSVRFMGQMPVERQDDDTNRLCAYDLPTQGKLVWEIDGAARSDELKGAFFLGAPVTVGQSLYCLAELKSETAIYLVALDRRTGDLRWRQQLADLETGIGRDIKRRLQASMPSYDGGMLVCPTGAGVVVGVDLAKQALAWAYRYQPVGRLTQRQRMLEGYALKAKRQWVHSVPVIADGRILLTPPESNQLHCLDLLTGRLIWKQPRGDSLFLAGVEFLDGVGSSEGDQEGRVLLVGNRKITALRLADGKPAWSSENMNLPDDGIPTGSGFFSKGQYFLPLSNAQVIAVDVATGKMVAHASSRDGQQLGNLICYRGAVISQTGRYLDCFEQVDVLREESERRLVTSPTDFEALRTLGEIAYNEGQLSRAVELLSKAYESEPDDIRTREVLGEALVAALDEEFAEYRTYLPLLAQIQQGSAEERFTLMRLQSQGLLELGRAAEAFEVCLKAYDELALLETELSIGREHHVSGERWLAAQVAAAWTSASQDQREQITEQFGPLLEQTRQVADTSVWRSFYDCFGSLESTESLGIELATEYLAQGELLASQQLLLKLIESANPNVRRAAIANSSRLLHKAGKPFLAVTYDQQLRSALAEAECLPGMTGLQCLAEWASAEDSIQPSWPYGRVDLSVEESKATGGAQRGSIPRSGIYLERSDAVLGNCNVTLLGVVSGHNRVLTVRDSFGRDFFQAKLDQGTQRMMNVPGSVYGVSRGNLLVVSLGRQIVAYDTLSSSGQALWRMNTTSNLMYLHQRGLNRHNTRLQGRLGRLRSNRPQNNGNWLGLIGPISRDSCVFQIEQRLVCVDVLSGEIKWSQDKLPLGCDLYGDEEYVFAVPKNTKHALVFSTVDGRRLGETAHNLPAWKEQLATVGRQVVRWRKRADRRWELSSIDSLQSEVLWKHDFEKNSLVDVAQNRYAAIVGPTGHCTILDIHDGEFLVDQPIEANLSSNEVHLMVGTKSFVLAVQQPGEAFGNRPVKGLNGTDYSKAFTGQVYAFDRQSGRAMWDRPAEVQGLPLVLTQPVDLPMIAFAGNIHRQARNRTKPEMGILLLEKSSGRMLFHDETLPQSSHYFFLRASDTELHEAVVEMSTRKIRLAFTDRPRSPEPPARRDVQKKAGAGTGGLQKIGGKIWSGG
ncbi:MAG: PQQ-binding-like beta-propeller repeat protein [Planctomycetes bacterium]|nr:PQQ-binding-like beta-propeller repeat protein [Planctomycetota bacterium]